MLIGIKDKLYLSIFDVETTDMLLTYLKAVAATKDGSIWPKDPPGFKVNVYDRQEFSNLVVDSKMEDVTDVLEGLTTEESVAPGGYLVLNSGVYSTDYLCKVLRVLVVAEPEDTSWGVNEASDNIWITPANGYILTSTRDAYRGGNAAPLIADVVECQNKTRFVTSIDTKPTGTVVTLSNADGTERVTAELRHCKLLNRTAYLVGL